MHPTRLTNPLDSDRPFFLIIMASVGDHWQIVLNPISSVYELTGSLQEDAVRTRIHAEMA
jgi:hypothetical protein